jgi:hypothetical protein
VRANRTWTNAEHRALAEPNTVLLGLVGSTVHGVTVDDGDDRDKMGICIEPPEYVARLRRFAQWVYRTQPEGARSGPGDVDRTVYSLRKWCRLALSGNPTVMLLLQVPDAQCKRSSRRWTRCAAHGSGPARSAGASTATASSATSSSSCSSFPPGRSTSASTTSGSPEPTAYQQRAAAFAEGDPVVTHLVSADLPTA